MLQNKKMSVRVHRKDRAHHAADDDDDSSATTSPTSTSVATAAACVTIDFAAPFARVSFVDALQRALSTLMCCDVCCHRM